MQYDIDNYRWHLPTEADRTWIESCIVDAPEFIFTAQDILDHAEEFRAWEVNRGPRENLWAPCILTKIETNTPVVIITGMYETLATYSIRGMIVHPDYRDTGELLASSTEMGKWLLYRSDWGIVDISIVLPDSEKAQTLNSKWQKMPTTNPDGSELWKRGK